MSIQPLKHVASSNPSEVIQLEEKKTSSVDKTNQVSNAIFKDLEGYCKKTDSSYFLSQMMNLQYDFPTEKKKTKSSSEFLAFTEVKQPPKLLESQVEMLYTLVEKNKTLARVLSINDLIGMELYDLILRLIEFSSITSEKQATEHYLLFKWSMFYLDVTDFAKGHQINPADFSEDDEKKLLVKFDEMERFITLACEKMWESKVSKLKTAQAKKRLQALFEEKERPTLVHICEHLKLYRAFVFSKESFSLLFSNKIKAPGVDFSLDEKEIKNEFEKIFHFVRFFTSIFLMQKRMNTSKDQQIIEKIEKSLKSVDFKESKEGQIQKFVFILDFLDEALNVEHSGPNKEFFEYFCEKVFHLSYSLVFYTKENGFSDFDLWAKRGLFIFLRRIQEESRFLIKEQVFTSHLEESLFEKRSQFHKRIEPLLDVSRQFIHLIAKYGCLDLFCIRAQLKRLLHELKDPLEEVIEKVFLDLLESKQEVVPQEFIESNLWLVEFLALEHDLNVFVNVATPKKEEEIFEPIFKMFEALDIKQESEAQGSDPSFSDDALEQLLPGQSDLKTLSLEESKPKITQVKASKSSTTFSFSKKEEMPEAKKRARSFELRAQSYKHIQKALSKMGFVFLRNGRGSHEIWGDPKDRSLRTTIPRHGEIKVKTVHAIASDLNIK